MIFGAVLGLGLASYGIVSFIKKQAVATRGYESSKVRYNREKRIDEISGGGGKKEK